MITLIPKIYCPEVKFIEETTDLEKLLDENQIQVIGYELRE